MKRLGKTVGAAVLAAMVCGAGTAQALSPRQAACYEQITDAHLAHYGSPKVAINGGVLGFLVATLIDFDGDGTEELVCSYDDYKHQNQPRSYPLMQQVWTYRDGDAALLYEGKATNLGPDPDPEVMLYVNSKKAYLVTGMDLNSGSEAVYWTMQDGQWVAALRYVDAEILDENGALTARRCEINGKPATPEELDAALAALTEGMAQRRYQYYDWRYEYETGENKIVAEQNKTLQALARVARPVATPSAAALTVNGTAATAPAYLIAGNNYFRLRDAAALLSGTNKQFSVDWDRGLNRITLETGKPYTAAVTAAPMQTTQASACMSDIVVDDVKIELSVYNIGGSNYVMLRDLAETLDFSVTWNARAGCVEINTARVYTRQS